MRVKMRREIREEANLGNDLRIGSVGINVSRGIYSRCTLSPELKKEKSQCKKKDRSYRVTFFDIADYQTLLISISALEYNNSCESREKNYKK